MAYIRAMKDIYDGVKTWVSTLEGDLEFLLVKMGLHQESTLSMFLFAWCLMN